MAATWESANSDPTTASGDTSMVVTAPAGITVGDLLLAFGFCVTSKAITPPSGFAEKANDSDGSARVYVWTKVADSGDAAASNFTFPTATFSQAVVSMHRISGASSSDPTMAFSTGPNNQAQTCPTIVTPTNNCLVFWGAAHTSNQATSTANKGSERVDNGNGTSGCWMAQYSNLEATAGSITGAIITTSGFGAKRIYSVAIESAGGGGGGGKPWNYYAQAG